MSSTAKPWYALNQVDTVDSPALLIYPERVQKNIQHLIEIAGNRDRLIPHVKTHKMAEVARMHVEAEIRRFKCSTIAEAEMLATSGAEEILLAYQPVGPKLGRLIQLATQYPSISFGALVDNESSLSRISHQCKQAGIALRLWLDVNNGMGRTGIELGPEALRLYTLMSQSADIQLGGLHMYDGQFRQSEFANRKQAVDAAFLPVQQFIKDLEGKGLNVPAIITGGSPTFPVHALRDLVHLSPGTYVFWDAGYKNICAELPFLHAAVLLCRIISKPGGDRICLDLGHKAVGSENPIDKRVRFLNADVMEYLGQSEEHLVVQVADPHAHHVGDVWYGIPWHVCPTVALHQEGIVVENGEVRDRWAVIARDRRILV